MVVQGLGFRALAFRFQGLLDLEDVGFKDLKGEGFSNELRTSGSQKPPF